MDKLNGRFRGSLTMTLLWILSVLVVRNGPGYIRTSVASAMKTDFIFLYRKYV